MLCTVKNLRFYTVWADSLNAVQLGWCCLVDVNLCECESH